MDMNLMTAQLLLTSIARGAHLDKVNMLDKQLALNFVQAANSTTLDNTVFHKAAVKVKAEQDWWSEMYANGVITLNEMLNLTPYESKFSADYETAATLYQLQTSLLNHAQQCQQSRQLV